jgi:hypothetical protein
MGDKEKMDYLLVDIRELEKLVASMRDAEIYPVSFFSQAYTTTQKIVDNLQSIEADQLALFKEQMEKHRALIKKAERLEAEAALVTQMQEQESNYEPVQEMELPSVEELKKNSGSRICCNSGRNGRSRKNGIGACRKFIFCILSRYYIGTVAPPFYFVE